MPARGCCLLQNAQLRNSLVAGRSLGVRVVLAQTGAALTMAALFALQGMPSALSALCGGIAIAVGTALLALRMFARQADSGLALAGVLAGLALKWLVVIAALYLALGRWQLPALPCVAAIVAGLTMNLLALRFKS